MKFVISNERQWLKSARRKVGEPQKEGMFLLIGGQGARTEMGRKTHRLKPAPQEGLTPTRRGELRKRIAKGRKTGMFAPLKARGEV